MVQSQQKLNGYQTCNTCNCLTSSKDLIFAELLIFLLMKKKNWILFVEILIIVIPCVWQWTSNLGINNFTGVVPQELGNLTKLITLLSTIGKFLHIFVVFMSWPLLDLLKLILIVWVYIMSQRFWLQQFHWTTTHIPWKVDILAGAVSCS
jgi:hypothetical protein